MFWKSRDEKICELFAKIEKLNALTETVKKEMADEDKVKSRGTSPEDALCYIQIISEERVKHSRKLEKLRASRFASSMHHPQPGSPYFS